VEALFAYITRTHLCRYAPLNTVSIKNSLHGILIYFRLLLKRRFRNLGCHCQARLSFAFPTGFFLPIDRSLYAPCD
jgi:hypothetical protein